MTKHVLRAAEFTEFLRDLVARLVIEVRHLPGRVMIADLLTKAVARVLYHELLRLFDAYAACLPQVKYAPHSTVAWLSPRP